MSYLENVHPSQLLSALRLNRQEVTHTVVSETAFQLAIFGAGLLAGAGIALMLAPKSGRELRGDIGRQAGRLTDAVREKIPSLPGSAKGTAEWGETSHG